MISCFFSSLFLSFTPPLRLSHLQDFLTKYSETNLQFSDTNVNFVRHQILQYARDILEKSRENKLTKEQFILLSENLEQAIVEVRTRLGNIYVLLSFQRKNSMYVHLYENLVHS